MKKSVMQVVIVMVLIVAGATLWWLWQYFQAPELTEGFASGNGRIEAVQIDISTKIPGRVEAVLVKEGDLVLADQSLALIDTAQIKTQLLRAEADVASAQSLVASAQATILQAKAQQVLAEQELSRIRELIKKNHASQEVYDVKVSDVTVAQANLKAAQAMLVSRLRNVDAARASVAEIQTQINDATLVSPTIARVLYRLAEPGEVLGSGGKVLTLINLSDIYMEVFLPSAQVNRIAIGAPARIKLDIIDIAIPATVSFISPESQFTPKQVETQSEREKLMFRVKVRVPQDLVLDYIDSVKTGVRGVAYIQLTALPGESQPLWPAFLQKLPPDIEPSAMLEN